MSGVSSVGGSNDLLQLLQSTRQSKSAGTAKAAGQGRPPEPPAEFKAQFEAKAQSAGIDIKKLDGLKDQIQTAASSALEGSENLSDSDKQTKVQDAINGVLKDNGFDPEKLKSQFESLGAGGPPGGFGGGGFPGGIGGAQGGSKSFQIRGYQASGTSSSSSSQSDQLISSLLEQLQSGSKGDSKSNGIDFASLFKNLPSGSGIDVAT